MSLTEKKLPVISQQKRAKRKAQQEAIMNGGVRELTQEVAREYPPLSAAVPEDPRENFRSHMSPREDVRSQWGRIPPARIGPRETDKR